MPIIDIHEHLVSSPSVPIRPGAKERMITAAELVAVMDREGIDKAIALPLSSPETFQLTQSNEDTFAACDMYPYRFIKFCNVDPRLNNNSPESDLASLLEHYKAQGAKGVGEITANLWFDDPRVQNLFAACERMGLPVLFHIAVHEFSTYGLIDEAGLLGLERALQKFPRLQFIGHSQAFWSEVGVPRSREERGGYPEGRVQPGGRVPALMRKYDHLWGDLSAGSGCNAISRDPEWAYDFIEEFQDRLLLGLDLCVPRETLDNYCLPVLGTYRDDGKISPQTYAKIMGANAVQLLGLEKE